MRTEKEMRDKLENYDYSEGVIERVMEFLLKYGYIDHGVDGDTMLMPAQGHFTVEKQSPVQLQSPCPQSLAIICLLRALIGMGRGLLPKK